jgi:hypothetical protein
MNDPIYSFAAVALGAWGKVTRVRVTLDICTIIFCEPLVNVFSFIYMMRSDRTTQPLMTPPDQTGNE